MTRERRRGQMLAGAAIAVALVIAAALVVVGSPTAQRLRRLDERRVADLAAIARGVDTYRKKTGALPAALGELARSPDTFVTDRDPESGEAYAYRAIDGATYELCATFASASPSEARDRFWTHPAGRHCFRIEGRDAARPD